VPYSFLDGEVTFAAAPPWDGDEGGTDGFLTLARSWLTIEADPLPVAPGCGPGSAPADARALARSLRSDPELEATAPVAVDVGGVDALRIDVQLSPGLAPGAGCGYYDGPPMVAQEAGFSDGTRMRLYLLDLPGGSARTLAIAIVASAPDFEQVVESAAPIVDSFEFHTE
jgi:hypothetical protein